MCWRAVLHHACVYVLAAACFCVAESLRDYFGKYGEIVEVSVKVDPVTKRRRGFGFLTFKHRESADQVLREKEERGHVVDGKSVSVRRYRVWYGLAAA